MAEVTEEDFQAMFGEEPAPTRSRRPRPAPGPTKEQLDFLKSQERATADILARAQEGAREGALMQKAHDDPFVSRKGHSLARRAAESKKRLLLEELLQQQRDDRVASASSRHGPIGAGVTAFESALERQAETLLGPNITSGVIGAVGGHAPDLGGSAGNWPARAKELGKLSPAIEKAAEKAAKEAYLNYLREHAGLNEEAGAVEKGPWSARMPTP